MLHNDLSSHILSVKVCICEVNVEWLLLGLVNKLLNNVSEVVHIIMALAFCFVELYRKTSSLSSGFPLDSVMLRFSDVTNTLESLAKFTRSSLTKVPHMLDRRSGTLLELLYLLFG